MTAYELADAYVNILRALSTVEGMLKHYKQYYGRTKADNARRGVRRQQRRAREIRRTVRFIERALGRVDVPTAKQSVVNVWPSFVRWLDGRLQRSWRHGH